VKLDPLLQSLLHLSSSSPSLLISISLFYKKFKNNHERESEIKREIDRKERDVEESE
jgi:menaquinone-dependent protoporphyrinogen IX oxidase